MIKTTLVRKSNAQTMNLYMVLNRTSCATEFMDILQFIRFLCCIIKQSAF